MKEKDNKKLIYLDEIQEANLEENMGRLLGHMQGLRERVPVNRQLKEELRKKLLEGAVVSSKISPVGETSLPVQVKDRKINLAQWLGVAVILLVIGGILFGVTHGNQVMGPGNQPEDLREIISQPKIMGDLDPAPGNGKKVYFSRAGVIWETDSLSSGSRVLFTPPSGVRYRDPAPSPDGKTLMVAASDSQGETLIWLPLEGQQLPLGVTLPKGKKISRPAWSPSGGEVAFAMDGKIAILDVQVNQLREVCDGEAPTWSPDGKTLAYQREQDGSWGIWLVGKDGKNPRFLVKGEQPDWSSQGPIAFVQERVWEKNLEFSADQLPRIVAVEKVKELWVTDEMAKVTTKVTSMAGPTLEQEGKLLQELKAKGQGPLPWKGMLEALAQDVNPRWSTDGSYLVAQRQRDGMNALLWIGYKEGRAAR